jgi:hypothetical protein
MSIRSKIEKTFAAAAFAEAGEHDTAIRMAEVTDKPKSLLEKLLRGWQNHMAAVAFAEMDERDGALHWVGAEKRGRNRKDTLADFLEKVGLENARVSYGIVPLKH